MNITYVHKSSFIFIFITTLSLIVVNQLDVKDFPILLFNEIILTSILLASCAWFYFNYPFNNRERLNKKKLIARNNDLKKLNAELERTQSILESTNMDAKIGGWEVDLVKNKVFWTKVTKLIHDLPEEFQPDLKTAIYYYKEGIHRDAIEKSVENLIKTGESYKIEAILITAKGNEKWIRAFGNAEMKDGVCVRIYGTIQDIHEKKIQSMQLIDNEQKYRLLFENNNVPFILFDENRKVINANEAATSLFGYEKEEFLLLKKPDLFSDFFEKEEELINKRKKYGYAIIEFQGIKKDNTTFDSEVYSSRFINSDGKINVLKIIKDTSALKEANNKIRKTEESFSKLTEKAEIGIYEFQIDTEGEMKLNFASKGFEKIFSDVAIDKILHDFSLILLRIHPDDIKDFIKNIDESRANVSDWNATYRIIIDHKVKWVKSSSKCERKSNGTIVWYGYVQDITDLMDLENKLEENQKSLIKLTHKIDICLFELITDGNGMRFNFISNAFKIIFPDIPIKEIKKDASLLLSRVHPEDLDKVVKSIINAIKTQSTWIHEYRILNNQEIVWLKGEASPEIREDGTISWYGFLEDITHKREEYIRLKLLESVVTHSNDMILITEAEPIDDPGPKIIYVNDAFERITGYTKEELINKTPRLLQGPETSKVKLERLKESMKKWETHNTEVLNYKKNGEPFWNNFTIVPIADETGWYTHWVAIERDVTEQRKIILELEERNEVLEQIAFKQSHIVRAPLARIMGLIDLLKKYPEENSPDLLGYIKESADELDTIIRDIVNSANQKHQ